MTGKPLSILLDEALATADLMLPLPAEVARQGLEVVDGNPAATTLGEFLGGGPVLAGILFRCANSAFYRGLAPVAGIDEALIRVGTERVGSEIRQYCTAALAAPPGILLPVYLPRLERHSVGCALGTRWLAERCGYRLLAEPAQLAGLLHDIGKYALLAGLERLAGDETIAPLLSPQLVEGVLADRHVAAGLRLHVEWGLPAAVAAVIGRHHDSPGDVQELLVVLVRLANLACRKLGLGSVAETDLVLPTTAEAQALGLDEIALAELEIMLEDRVLLALDNPVCAGYHLNVVQP